MKQTALADSKKPRWSILLATVVVLIQSGCTVFGIRSAEEASYVVVDQQGEFELREYDRLVVAETTIDAKYSEAGSAAFGKLFGYISGKNSARQKIAMTAPVIASEDGSSGGESIEMTAPVIASQDAGGWKYAFVLSNGYTLDNAPVPSDPSVKLVEIAPKRVAVMRYSGSSNAIAFRENSVMLQTWMQQNQLEAASLPRVAGYDPPWTLWFLRRNEVMIDVRS